MTNNVASESIWEEIVERHAQIARSKTGADRKGMAQHLDSNCITPATCVKLLEKGKKAVTSLLRAAILSSPQYEEICKDAAEGSTSKLYADMAVLQVWMDSLAEWASAVVQGTGGKRRQSTGSTKSSAVTCSKSGKPHWADLCNKHSRERLENHLGTSCEYVNTETNKWPVAF